MKVEADRGEDMGVIVGKISVNDFLRQEVSSPKAQQLPMHNAAASPTRGGGGASGNNPANADVTPVLTKREQLAEMKRVVRLASVEEKVQLREKGIEEDSVLRICRNKVGRSVGRSRVQRSNIRTKKKASNRLSASLNHGTICCACTRPRSK